MLTNALTNVKKLDLIVKCGQLYSLVCIHYISHYISHIVTLKQQRANLFTRTLNIMTDVKVNPAKLPLSFMYFFLCYLDFGVLHTNQSGYLQCPSAAFTFTYCNMRS